MFHYKRKTQYCFIIKEKDKFSFIIKEKDRPRPVPVDIGSRGRRTPSPRAFWPPNRTLSHHLTNRPRLPAQNFKANPTVIVDLRDQHFFFDFFSRVRTSDPGSPSKTRGTRLTLVYATPYNAPYTSLRHAIQPLALRGAQGAPGGPRGPQGAPGALWGPGPYGAQGTLGPRAL